jgi:hypothetical protein
MENAYQDRALSSIAGIFALALWCIYILLMLASIPDVQYRVMINSFFGLLACVAVVVNFRYWRLSVLLACCVYLVTYVVLIARMTSMMAGSDTPLLSALAFYYTASWAVATGVFVERGAASGLAHGFLEYAMPILVVVLLLLTLMPRRAQPAAPYAP